MDRFQHEDHDNYEDLSTVQSEKNELIPEEFPEGPYGTDLQSESLGKSGPWRLKQRTSERFGYENRALHDGLDRDYPGEDKFGAGVPEVQDEP